MPIVDRCLAKSFSSMFKKINGEKVIKLNLKHAILNIIKSLPQVRTSTFLGDDDSPVLSFLAFLDDDE